MNPSIRPAPAPLAPPLPTRPPEELVKRYEVTGPRYTSYPTAPSWRPSFDARAYGERLERAARDGEAPLSLYVHLPFCRRLCTYCGCNVVVTRKQAEADAYLEHLERELDLACARLGERRSVSQLHWGGGTPTFLDEQQLERLWLAITSRFRLMPGAEVAVEVNPATTTLAQLSMLGQLGFNRVSMGVQDFDPTVQRTVNRHQTPEQTIELLDFARALGFSGVNFDLVYGLPHQTDESWERTLAQVLEMRPDRFAVYAFAFLPESIPHQRKLPRDAMPTGPRKLGLFWRAYEALTAAGYRPIGMDHFALPDDELSRAQDRRELGRNFQGYTVKSAADVVAFGASGISDVAGAYAQSARELPAWYAAIEKGELATVRGAALSEDDLRRRTIIGQLMCNFWVDLGPDGPRSFAPELERLRPLEDDGLIRVEGPEITVTPLGRFFVRNVAMAFDAYLPGLGATRFSRTV